MRSTRRTASALRVVAVWAATWAVCLAGCTSPEERPAPLRESKPPRGETRLAAHAPEEAEPLPTVIRRAATAEASVTDCAEHSAVLRREARRLPRLSLTPWRCERTDHFLLFVERASTPAELVALEVERRGALERLGLTEELVPRSRCVPVFVFEREESFRGVQATSVTWADGCACYSWSGERFERAIYVTRRPSRPVALMVRHEIAHVFAGEAFGEHAPTWAVEGVACYAEGDRMRQEYESALSPGSAIDIARVEQTRYDDLTRSDAYDFYVRAFVLFDRLVRRAGSVARAIEIARDMRSSGVREGLARAGVDVFELAADMARPVRQSAEVAPVASARPVGSADPAVADPSRPPLDGSSAALLAGMGAVAFFSTFAVTKVTARSE